ncbi:hypothetical protein B7463_g382, partial [Scytalidium lignicola]
MNCVEDDSPRYTVLHSNSPDSLSTASSTSPSSSSVWSDSASQSSDDSSVSIASDTSETYHPTSSLHLSQADKQDISITSPWLKQQNPSLSGPEVGRHPKRTNTGPSEAKFPPSLARQRDRKIQFVSSLIDTSAKIVEAIWPLSSIVCPSDKGHVLPLKTFIREMLRRSKTSYSTLQVALYYLVLIKPHLPERDFTMEQTSDDHSIRVLQCGRRMFLSALILATKYLQDRNYSASAWSKISGLNTAEINQSEMAFLMAVNFELFIPDTIFQRWADIVLKYSCPKLAEQVVDWKSIIQGLNPEKKQGLIIALDKELSKPNSLVLAPNLLHTAKLMENSKTNTPAESAASDVPMKSSMDCPILRVSKNTQSSLMRASISDQSSDKCSIPPIAITELISNVSSVSHSTVYSIMGCETDDRQNAFDPSQTSGCLQKSIRAMLLSASHWTEDSMKAHAIGMGLGFPT